MPTKFNENPLTTDEIEFDFITYDNNNLPVDAYKVDKIIIYYVERNFSSSNLRQYTDSIYVEEKLQLAEAAELVANEDPTEENITAAQRARLDAESAKTTNTFYFNEAKPVHVVGTANFPAWLSTDTDNALIEHITEDEDGNPLIGNFRYTWLPQGMREGDYFVCYTWTPLIADNSVSSHVKFYLKGNNAVTTLPIHATIPGKYEKLLERYTPDLFKMYLCDTDRTPDVLEKLNKSVAAGFTVLEDLANQIIDLYDANTLDESLLPYLSNFFNLRLKSQDPTRWRKQIKQAIPLFKKKGTNRGLNESLDQAGVKLIKYDKLWQITSPSTWQESFTYNGENLEWYLSKIALDFDVDNFGLWRREVDSDEYTELTNDYVEFTTEDGITTLEWIGHTLLVDPITLEEGDIIKVLYKYSDVENQTLEDYIRSLPTADQRDERDQDYPLKNWNVKVISQDDPLFDNLIQNHPYQEAVIFGQIRTEFPYSENIYNMEEYNGSIRNSENPCDIDKNFLDECNNCLSSSYNLDVEIEELTNDRIIEVRQILKENMPFHAVLHTMNILGGINEFVESPEETVEIYIKNSFNENVISGAGQMYFNRNMKQIEILRDMLADSDTVNTGTGTAYNDFVVLFCGEVNFEGIGLATEDVVLEILTSDLEGIYSVSSPKNHTIHIDSISEPVDQVNSIFEDMELSSQAFNFRISNKITDGSVNCEIFQDNIFTLSDENVDFDAVKTQEDGTPWKIEISSVIYEIISILPDKILVLEDDGSLPSSNTIVSYSLLNNLDVEIATSTTGDLKVTKRGRTEVEEDVVLNFDDITYYQKIDGIQYKILGMVDGETDKFYIDNYDAGGMGGVTLEIYQRLAENQIGYLSHEGLKLQTEDNLEEILEINNGENSVVTTPLDDNNFKENFLIEIDSNLYFMEKIDGTTITLSGPDFYAKTLAAGGTSVGYTIYQYEKTTNVGIPGQQFDLPLHTFPIIDRQGSEIITNLEEMALAQNLGGLSENIKQEENITFQIEYSDGSIEQGTI